MRTREATPAGRMAAGWVRSGCEVKRLDQTPQEVGEESAAFSNGNDFVSWQQRHNVFLRKIEQKRHQSLTTEK